MGSISSHSSFLVFNHVVNIIFDVLLFIFAFLMQVYTMIGTIGSGGAGLIFTGPVFVFLGATIFKMLNDFIGSISTLAYIKKVRKKYLNVKKS